MLSTSSPHCASPQSGVLREGWLCGGASWLSYGTPGSVGLELEDDPETIICSCVHKQVWRMSVLDTFVNARTCQ